MHNQDSLLFKVFIDQRVSNEPNFWALSVKKLLCDLGFSNVLSNFDPNINYLPVLCQRFKYLYVQNWGAPLENSSKSGYYRKYKTYFCQEAYLNSIVIDNLRVQLCRFRTSSHMLDIEMGLFASVARDCRICKLFSLNQIESEYHFLLCCPMYRCLRTKYVGNTLVIYTGITTNIC